MAVRAGMFRRATTTAESFNDRFDRLRADLRPLSATETGFGSYSEVDVTLTNAGANPYADFADWDVVVNYVAAGGIQTRAYLPYSATPSDDTWRVQALHLDSGTATVELIGPGLLDPGEEAVLRLRLSPEVQNGSNGEVTVTSSNGRTAYVQFNG